jgi:hypothetical protein
MGELTEKINQSRESKVFLSFYYFFIEYGDDVFCSPEWNIDRRRDQPISSIITPT